MPINANTFIPNDVNMIIKEKVINDIDILLHTKKTKTKKELNKMKEEFLKEDFDILSNIYGIPPKTIDLALNNLTKNI